MCNKFNLRVENLVRPDKIDLPILMKRNTFDPKPVKTKGNTNGPFGSVFGGTEPGLMFSMVWFKKSRHLEVWPNLSVQISLAMLNLIDKEKVCEEGSPKMKVENRVLLTNNGIIACVITRSSHPTKLSQKFEC